MTNLPAPVWTVRVDGDVVGVDDVRPRGEIPSELTGPFTGGHGVVKAECSVDFTPPGGLVTGIEHPWLPRWQSRQGKTVTVDVDGLPGRSTSFRAFTGAIDSASFDGASVQALCFGQERLLEQEVSVGPVAYRMPPPVYGNPTLKCGMSSPWVTCALARHGGFYPHAPLHEKAIVAASMVGSTWPYVGVLVESWSNSRGEDWSPYARQTAWGGVACVDPYAVWEGRYETGPGTSSDHPYSIVVDLGDPRAGDDITLTALVNNDGAGFKVTMTDEDIVVYGIFPGEGESSMVTRSRTGKVTTRLQFMFTRSGTLSVWSLKTDDGATVVHNYVLDEATTFNGRDVTLTLDAQQGDVAAVQLFRGNTWLVDEPRTMRIRRNAYDLSTNGGIGTVPYLRGDALDLLSEQSKCEVVNTWVDEDGVLQTWDRDVADNDPVAHVITDARLTGGFDAELLDLPGNGFNFLSDGTPVDGGAYPKTNTGFTANGGSSENGTVAEDVDGYHILIVRDESSTTQPMFTRLEREFPVAEGTRRRVTIHCQVNSRGTGIGEVAGTAATIAARPVRNGNTVSGVDWAYGNVSTGSGEWEDLNVTIEIPPGANGVQVQVGNAGSIAFGGALRFRAFTTFGPGVVLDALKARLAPQQQYGRVVVTGRNAAPIIRPVPQLFLAAGSRQTLNEGDEYDEFFEPDADTTWLDVDTQLIYAGAPGSKFGAREGTYVGGHLYNTDVDAPNSWVDEEDWPLTLEQITPELVRITGTVATLPSDNVIITEPYPLSGSISDARKSDPLPELRGAGRVTWSDSPTVTGSDPGVVNLATTGPDLVHEGKWWLQSDYQRGLVAQMYADRLANPQPILEGVRTQLAGIRRGQRVLVYLNTVAGLRVDAVVVATAPTREGMDLTLRVLSADVTSLTLPQIPDIDEFLSA